MCTQLEPTLKFRLKSLKMPPKKRSVVDDELDALKGIVLRVRVAGLVPSGPEPFWAYEHSEAPCAESDADDVSSPKEINPGVVQAKAARLRPPPRPRGSILNAMRSAGAASIAWNWGDSSGRSSSQRAAASPADAASGPHAALDSLPHADPQPAQRQAVATEDAELPAPRLGPMQAPKAPALRLGPMQAPEATTMKQSLSVQEKKQSQLQEMGK